MEKQQIEQFMAANGKCFETNSLSTVRDYLAKADEAKSKTIMAAGFKNPTMMLIIAFFLGGFGVDRFMLGQTGLGIAKFITAGGCGIWSLIDLFTAMKRTKEYNMNKLMTL